MPNNLKLYSFKHAFHIHSRHYNAACSSPDVRYYDVVVPNVPPGLKFEGKFHNGTLLHVEAGSLSSSSIHTRARARFDRV